MIRVFLLDDHEIVRRGVRELIDGEDDLVVVGEAGTGAEAIARLPSTRPDVAVLDVQLGEGSGVEVCRDIRSMMPEVGCLMLTSFSDDEAVVESVLAGAQGYVLKQVVGSDLIESIRAVAAGRSLIPADVVEKVRDHVRAIQAVEDRIAELGPRERAILALLADGHTNREIGERLFLSEKTVKNYMSNVLRTLGMHRRTEAAVFAAKAAQRREKDLRL
ncbi:MAG TPA: response regulator transcription factor [Microthrixaceae bacterium]|nr:response regulator transcription factor [Microthrixaceae bacterium]HQF93114.1 response regulator transcription factor [Microthrixaceae bacterium]